LSLTGEKHHHREHRVSRRKNTEGLVAFLSGY
jgi:hypothetical protein